MYDQHILSGISQVAFENPHQISCSYTEIYSVHSWNFRSSEILKLVTLFELGPRTHIYILALTMLTENNYTYR